MNQTLHLFLSGIENRRDRSVFMLAAILSLALLHQPGAGTAFAFSQSRCESKWDVLTPPQVNPPIILGGQETKVSFLLEPHCPPPASPPSRMIFLVDLDQEASNAELKQVRDAIHFIADSADASWMAPLEYGLVSKSNRGFEVSKLNHDRSRLSRAINRIERNRETDLKSGLQEAKKQFPLFHPSCDVPARPLDMIIIFTSELDSRECQSAIAAARRLKIDSIRIYSICIGQNCRRTNCLPQVASSSRYYLELDEIESLIPLRFANFPDHGSFNCRTHHPWQYSETLSDDVEYVPGSAKPAGLISTDGKTLSWSIEMRHSRAISVTYSVKPLKAGLVKISDGSKLRWREWNGRQGSKVLPGTNALVIGRPNNEP